MCLDANKAVILRLFDEVFNRGRLAIVGELVSADCVCHGTGPGTPCGPEGVRQTVTRCRATFPSGRHVVEDLIGDDDRVAARIVFRGTLPDPHRGPGSAGRRVEQAQMHVFRFDAGRIAEHWALRDDLVLLERPGRLLPPSSPATDG